jgi:hypothetical protein
VSYFNNRKASNSDIKEIVGRHEGRTKPENIKELYSFGTEFHSGILEPHNANLSLISTEQVELIGDMAKTFWKDPLCRQVVMMPDFRREHEFYRENRFGIGARCKVDGCSRRLRAILELKGLGVSTYNSFLASLLHLDYDQGAAWYLNVASGVDAVVVNNYHYYDYKLIIGISKQQPDRLFKCLIDRNHAYYKSGMVKVHYGVNLWKNVYGFK